MSIKFEVGKYYIHAKGRKISIVGEVETTKWGTVLVVEETDRTGHAVSCIEKGSEDTADNWQEIGREEWLREFQNGNQE